MVQRRARVRILKGASSSGGGGISLAGGSLGIGALGNGSLGAWACGVVFSWLVRPLSVFLLFLSLFHFLYLFLFLS